MTDLTYSDIEELRSLPLLELMALAQKEKLLHRGNKFSLCSIINAKSGLCTEDCKFCVQSVHFKGCSPPVYPLMNHDEIIARAIQAKEDGAEHFSIVTSGRRLRREEVITVARIIEHLVHAVGIIPCTSLGILDHTDFQLLRNAGLARYHHNLETSKEFFPRTVTTHTFSERVATIIAAKEAGLEVCAGGILGLGETEDDRISLAITLRDLEVDSVPLNILIPIAETPFANLPPLPILDILRSIALFRLILKKPSIRLAAGRERHLADFLGTAFLAGADGMMIGGYLTQAGRSPVEDLCLVAQVKQLWSG